MKIISIFICTYNRGKLINGTLNALINKQNRKPDEIIIVNGGGKNNCQSTLGKWKSIFSKVGLKIDFHSNYGTEQLVKFWSIGLRPYSPFLIEMSNNINLKTRTKIKQKLIKNLTPLLKSYIDYELASIGNNNCFHLFVLKK